MGDIFNPKDEINKLNDNYRREIVHTLTKMDKAEQVAFALGQEKMSKYFEEYMAIRNMEHMSKLSDKDFEMLMQLKMMDDDIKGWGIE